MQTSGMAPQFSDRVKKTMRGLSPRMPMPNMAAPKPKAKPMPKVPKKGPKC